MKPTFSFLLLLILTLVVYPAGSFAFDYNDCVMSGAGTDVQTMGRAAWKSYSLERRQAACARIDNEVKGREAQPREIEREQRMFEPEQRAKQEAQTPAAVDPSAPFVLLNEVREPPAKRQPEISFGTNRESAHRYVRLSAKGQMAPREVQIVCDQETRHIPLTTTSTNDGRTVATYEASRATLVVALASERCELVLGGARLSIPQDKLFSAWGGSALPNITSQ